ncbi:MAG: patatin-like phospholipase family protein [Limibacillus sp.]
MAEWQDPAKGKPAPQWRSVVMPILLALALSACGTVPPRNPLPANGGQLASIPGLPENVRFWGDEVPEYMLEILRTASTEEIMEFMPAWAGQEHHFLAISGGGQNGAFGAGLINGWTASGTRPEFLMVTGISTGALSAPFVFLGPDYDDELTAVYTMFSTQDLIDYRYWLEALTSDAVLDTEKLRDIIASFMDDEMMRRLAEENARGRRLFVGTTHLDARRPVVWNITAIASSDYPRKKQLITDVLLASASIPGAFPPVLIDVQSGGKRYDELHVDGGTASQVFVYPPALDFRYFLQRFDSDDPQDVYVIRNSKLTPEWRTVEPNVFSLAKIALESLIRTQGLGDLGQIYQLTIRDGGNYHLAYIPEDFTMKPEEPFDREYMKALYQLGFDLAKNGYPWDSEPPNLRVIEVSEPAPGMDQ